MNGIYTILQWLSYVPHKKNAELPIIIPVDSTDRPVGFLPTKSGYDPRFMFSGYTNCNNEYENGFFDENSWCEIMCDWAPTVICGRARLGGIPVGVITAETRVTNIKIPADPANLKSESQVNIFFFLTVAL